MDGISEEDFRRELSAAESVGNQDRVEALHLAYSTINALEFAHIETTHQVRSVLVRQLKATDMAEGRLKPLGG